MCMFPSSGRECCGEGGGFAAVANAAIVQILGLASTWPAFTLPVDDPNRLYLGN